ncbi:class I SAM-dependent methyltransferase [Methylobacterium radiotolerans]|uniref:Methyltransferase family protein n=1 Tax=Methylobacterium radiotolerans (strain ATCC 27329 / DSM 1819 / JCM 2831 / NBRC 15690 / NCIMB 10815 / 0-1) TaxID=426355 RepID=B1M2T1_METRJ|nr:class I SAM-dependent methyltransferase [Methylobacterium radiotolerans]ACB23222.1 hypothetical protein Mrad2831_1218 [Methylobacterium radiotolerans JCM 2831]GEN00772.1 hypothetical protein MRA01_53110 [Methylobacterium radiotolerans]
MQDITMVETDFDRDEPAALFEWTVVEPLFQLPHSLVPTAWAGHIPFLFSLIKIDRPRTFVELGVFNGASMIAACSAARNYNTDTVCYGIDTWQGDEHAGLYEGDKIYADLTKTLAEIYPPARLLRGTFESQLGRFKDGTIDLLHIDGLHTYSAVKQDFDNWLPKMSERGIVLFHDTCVREREFGVWKLWEELSVQYPSMEFYHSFGLGVLFVGNKLSQTTKRLVDLWTNNDSFREFFRCTCEHVGAILPNRVQDRVNTELLHEARAQIAREQAHQIWLNRNWLHAQEEAECERNNSKKEIERINSHAYDNQISLWREVRKTRQVNARRAIAVANKNSPFLINIPGRRPLKHSDTPLIVSQTGLFDESFYKNEYSDVRDSGVNALEHFIQHGVREGRWPNEFFDTIWYISEYMNYDNVGMNPLIHYCNEWKGMNVNPNPYFSVRSYLEWNPDVAASGEEPCQHFLRMGGREGRMTDFSTPFYTIRPEALDRMNKVEALRHALKLDRNIDRTIDNKISRS